MTEAIILCGLQATGKSTFCRDRFSYTHFWLSADLARSRGFLDELLLQCLRFKRNFVIDSPCQKKQTREDLVKIFKSYHYNVDCYYFASDKRSAQKRNAARVVQSVVDEDSINLVDEEMQKPTRREAFDRLFIVKTRPEGFFQIKRVK